MQGTTTTEVAESSRRKRRKRSSCTVDTMESESPHISAQNQTRRSRRIDFSNGGEDPVLVEKRLPRSRKKKPAAIGGQAVPTQPSKLSSPTTCIKCGAKKFMYEPPKFCCGGGEVKLANIDYPEKLVDLYTGWDDDAVHFKCYSRLYNNLFAFTSLGGSFDAKTVKGIYVFKAHGQMYHFLPDLLPENNTPKYLQLYFYDAQHEKENRLGYFPQLKPEVISTIMNVMEQNPYAKFFRSLQEIEISENTRIALNQNTVLDQRVFNTPTADEVAAIWLDSSSDEGYSSPHIVAYGKSNQSHLVKHYYGCYDPMQYPLLFPKGECGWHQGIKKVSEDREALNPEVQITSEVDHLLHQARVASRRSDKSNREVSCREYYGYKLQIRAANLLLKAGRLFQQFIVDVYVKIESTRLDFLRRNQDTIRADLYQGIIDTFTLLGENSGANVGRRVILPPSFIGGPRDMRRRYLNAMALVQKYGKPDLFLTITCNPNWPELKAELAQGEQSQNRPDLVARIFRAKLTALRKEIMEKKVFGDIAAMIHVVEFQKRGLPHAHFLIILKPDYKIKTPEDFDHFVSAELPSQSNPHLRAAVIRHMMHGPCGVANPECACMRQKGAQRLCKSGYPKQFSEFTTSGKDCYPSYRRRNTGESITVRRVQMDNRSVIPYNPYLLAMFDCHMNVEVCSTVKAVKYLYKYVYKGHDQISFNLVRESVDEIEQYQSGRWVSPPEAAWRIFSFDLFDTYPPVLHLPVHTQNKQLIRFDSNEALESIVADENRSKTMLTQFFKMNNDKPDGQKYLYSEFPEHFVWDEKNKAWKDRQRGIVVGRVAYAAPGEGERYYLRLLLAHVRGPKSFEDLLMVHGYSCTTFQESALKRGLLEGDDSMEWCMNEAIEVQMPQSLRRLFATLLIFCHPNDPKEFWLKYYNALSDDYRHQFPHDERKVLQLTSLNVEQFLEGMGKTFADFNLRSLHDVQDAAIRNNKDIDDALSAPIPSEYLSARKELNQEQRAAYKSIIWHIKNEKPGAFFIDGPGGTGKTFLYCALYAKVRSMGKICLPTATSGIAASNMPTGRTAHSRFKIPTDNDSSLTCNVPKQGGLASLLRQTSLIIWDEASMAKKENIRALDLLLQDVCGSTSPFGGKIVVFGGDFRQVLPVLPRQTQREAVDASLVSSYLWPTLTKFRLSENMRAREDPEFSEFLLRLGNGALQTDESAFVALPCQLMLQHSEGSQPIEPLVHAVFPEISSVSFSTEIFTNRAILTPKNDDVDSINKLLITSFPGEPYIYKSFDSVIDEKCNVYPNEFLNTLCPGGMSPHELILKPNCPVILLRNLDPAAGLCNGTRLICKNFFPNMIACEIATGYYKGEHVFLPRITLKPSASSKYPFNFQRRQFPIKLSFAMTINKAQGQTLHRVGVYLPKPCFSHGQLYVALSRARTAEQLTIVTEKINDQSLDTCLVKNIVSFEILRRAEIIPA